MLYDTHVHTTISGDGKDSTNAVVESAIAKGLTGLCFTDHLDLFEPKQVGVKREHGYTTWQKSYEEIATAREKYGNQIEILHGMELAEIHMDPERAKKIIASPGLDYVLGSIHMVEGYIDFCWMDYPNLQYCKDIMGLYLEDITSLAKLNLADSIAHIGYPQRYMVQHGFSINIMDYKEQLVPLFTLMAQQGQGMEINTSGIRQGAGGTFPSLSALHLFKSCGGEIVTIGSDSHTAQDVGSNLQDAKDMLHAAGFKYYTVFKQRKAHFVTL